MYKTLYKIYVIDGADCAFRSLEEAKAFQARCNADIDKRIVDDEDIIEMEVYELVEDKSEQT